jgi:hypothetical protein
MRNNVDRLRVTGKAGGIAEAGLKVRDKAKRMARNQHDAGSVLEKEVLAVGTQADGGIAAEWRSQTRKGKHSTKAFPGVRRLSGDSLKEGTQKES